MPALNAALNAVSLVFLGVGFGLIHKGRRVGHRRAMLAAVATSTLFLISYLTYHSQATAVTTFPEAYPVWRRVYLYGILLPHTILAALVLPLVIITLWHAARGQLPKHRRIARWTLPLWAYVNLTGVLIYFMLYHWFTKP